MDELSEFLKKNGYDATPDEIVAIIRRLDTDGSQTITLIEFSKYLKLLNPAPQQVDV
jgi:Ca2+-binding EF-hand superfamily protein